MNKLSHIFTGIKSNISPGIVVFLVALPLCLGIALASGAPPLSGIIAGIIGGIVIGALSNSHISVSGPAAGLAAIVLGAITELGSFQLFLVAGFIAGLIQLLLGIFRAGSISNYFPNNIIEGMLAGIGIIIFFKQIPLALGMSSAIDFSNLGGFVQQISPGVVIVTVVSLFILILWDKVAFLKKLKMLPGALVAVIVGIVLNQLFNGTSLHISNDNLVVLPTPTTAEEFKSLIVFPDLAGFLNPKVWVLGATIAIVASIESLLCIEAADRMDPHKRITDSNLELRAQGIGNIISSLIGGLPITSVVVRSTANVNAGATSKASAIIHGVLLLICVLSIPVLLNKIPLATLAAVLLIVGYKLASPQKILHFWKKGKYQFLPFIATVVSVVGLDLLKGVALGLVISIFYILQGNMKRAYYLSREDLEDADEIKIDLAEEVSFLNKAAIKKTLKNIKPNSTVTINAKRTSYISEDILEMIEDFSNTRAKEDHIKVNLIGFKTSHKEYEAQPQTRIVIAHRRAI
ncbi:SulP family inorganic anion transporter [Elizabethkingia sp. JS20170427COW]|uniref:SulP family inorganic anion transporter n=1 Tax=Elizabethkingia sp. JS20170427COW TaxID=2583851 RepID=UPI001110EFF8|nr:SulP family inorganic anion transporter [Elizabethkingia sp. JS20170427COW]QCX53646.1 SulP family inorganic anion transporter [Elizabethkingia sp. JS20170427COW]